LDYLKSSTCLDTIKPIDIALLVGAKLGANEAIKPERGCFAPIQQTDSTVFFATGKAWQIRILQIRRMKNMKKQIKIGADPFPPYQYYDESGSVRGTDYEAVKAAGTKAGFDMEFVIDDWTLIERKFTDGALDAVFQLPKTPEREQKFHFSKLLRNGVTETVTGQPSLQIRTIHDIETHQYTLGVVDGVSYGAEVDALSADYKVKYKSNETLLVAIANSEADFGMFDQGVKQFLIGKLSVKGICVIQQLTFTRQLYMAFNDIDIKNAFDKYL
jgi:ABC-type amino acid transport substrate-binding protein